MNKLSDKFIWKSLKEGNLNAFSVLFETYYPQLHNYGFKISKDVAITEDTLQDFFLYIYEHKENLRDLETIAPYQFTSYKRFLLNVMQKNEKQNNAFNVNYSFCGRLRHSKYWLLLGELLRNFIQL